MFWYTFMPKLFNMSLTASVAIVFVILLRLLLRKAPKVISYALWGVVLFRLLFPVSIESDFSLYNLFDVPTEESGTMTGVIEYVPEDIVHTEYPSVALPVPGISDVINGALPQGQEQLAADPLEAPMSFTTYIWMLGVLIMVIYSIVSYARLRGKLLASVKLCDNIYIADDIDSPFVTGLVRPKIYLPSALTEAERGYIILHEQYHIRRGDHIIKLLSFAALCLHWFNPLVWAAFILSGKDMEMSCDEAVIRRLGEGIRADYSASLVSLATGRRIIAGTPLAFGEGSTEGRIRNLAKWKKPALWVVVIAVIVCGAAVVCLITNPVSDDRMEDGSGEDETSTGADQILTENIAAAESEEENSVLPPNSASVVTRNTVSNRTSASFAHDGKFNALTDNNLRALIADSISLYFRCDEIEMPSIIPLFSDYPQITLTWHHTDKTLTLVDSKIAERFYFLYEGRTMVPLHNVNDRQTNLERYGADDLNGDGTISKEEMVKSEIGHRQTAYFEIGQDIWHLILYRLIALSEPDALFYNAEGNLVYKPLGTVFYTDSSMKITDGEGNILYPTEALEQKRMIMLPTAANVTGAFDAYLYVPLDGANYRYERIYDDPASVTRGKLIHTFTEEAGSGNVDWLVYALEEYPNRRVVLAVAGRDYMYLYRYSPAKAVDPALLEQAKRAGKITVEDGDVTSGQAAWDAFYRKTQAGEQSVAEIVHYYTLGDPQRYGEKYYEVYREDYPAMYTFTLDFDGETYTLSWAEPGAQYVRTYKYLMCYTGESPTYQSAKAPQKVTRYVLTNDNTVTWDELVWGTLSSQMGDYIEHYTIYTDRE